MLANLVKISLLLVRMFSASVAVEFIHFDVLSRNARDNFLVGGFGLDTGPLNPSPGFSEKFPIVTIWVDPFIIDRNMSARTISASLQSEQQTDKVAIRPIEAFAKRYRSLDSVRFPVGDNLELVYSKAIRSGRVFPSHQVSLLSLCGEFKTIDEHARSIYHELRGKRYQAEAILSDPSAPLQIESIKRQLTRFAEAGLLISDNDVLGQCRYATGQEELVPQITSIGVVTRNRLKSLKRCLESYIDNCKQHGRDTDFVVMDDSETAEARAETRQMLRRLRERYDVEMFYAGLQEKKRYAEALITEMEVPAEVVKFALFGIESCGLSTGANRNALLLHTTGDLVFSVDDDTICQTGTVRAAEEGLALNSKREGFIGSWFYPDHSSALKSVIVDSEDVLAIHERLLGKTIGECISTYSELAEIEMGGHMSPGLLKGMQRGGKVGATIIGLVGDCGLHSPAGCLVLEGESRERLVESEAAYQSARGSREMVRAVDRLTISDSPWCMATAIGLDNRSFLPPFVPVYRNQDGLFGQTLRTCFDDVYFGHLPSTILHAPMEDRSFETDAVWRSATKFRFCDVVTACIRSAEFPLGAIDERERLRALGKYLVRLGNLALSDFEEVVRLHTWRIKSEFIMALENLLKVYRDKPDYWAKDVRRYIGILREALLREDYIVPQDVSVGRKSGEVRRQTQRLIYRVGELIYWWPQIVDAAKRFRTKNRRLAVAI
jgi:hypothetical protein